MMMSVGVLHLHVGNKNRTQVQVFPGCKANAGTVILKGPWTDFAKKNTGNVRLWSSD